MQVTANLVVLCTLLLVFIIFGLSTMLKRRPACLHDFTKKIYHLYEDNEPGTRHEGIMQHVGEIEVTTCIHCGTSVTRIHMNEEN